MSSFKQKDADLETLDPTNLDRNLNDNIVIK